MKSVESPQRDFWWHGSDPRIVSLLSVNLIEAQNEEVGVNDLINQKHWEAENEPEEQTQEVATLASSYQQYYLVQEHLQVSKGSQNQIYTNYTES